MIVQRLDTLALYASTLFEEIIEEITPMGVVLAVSGAITAKLIHRAFFSPLSAIPGPFLNSISNIPLLYHLIKGDYHNYVRKIHDKYGQLSRIGVDKLSLSNTSDTRRVLATHRFRKGDRYKNGLALPTNTFSTIDPNKNKTRRRQLGDAYSKHSIAQMEDIVMEYGVESLMSKWDRDIAQADDGTICVNYFHGFQTLTYDVIGILGFGESFGAVQNNDTRVMGWVQNALMMGTIRGFFPFIKPFSWTLGKIHRGNMRLIQHGREAIERRKKLISDLGKAPQNDILQRFIDAATNSKAESNPISDGELYSEALLLLVAGSDTTGNTLTWTLMYLLHYPEVYKRIVDEVRSVFPDRSKKIRYDEAKNSLPYLSAVLFESMRIRPSVSGVLPRVVPEGGTTIQGYHIPENTTLLVSIMACGRDKTIWDHPDIFDPTRFLGPKGECLSRELISFSAGVRSCLGRHLAWMELYTVLANLVRDYDFSLPENSPYGPDRKEVFDPEFPPAPSNIPGHCTLILGPKSSETDCLVNIKKAN